MAATAVVTVAWDAETAVVAAALMVPVVMVLMLDTAPVQVTNHTKRQPMVHMAAAVAVLIISAATAALASA